MRNTRIYAILVFLVNMAVIAFGLGFISENFKTIVTRNYRTDIALLFAIILLAFHFLSAPALGKYFLEIICSRFVSIKRSYYHTVLLLVLILNTAIIFTFSYEIVFALVLLPTISALVVFLIVFTALTIEGRSSQIFRISSCFAVLSAIYSLLNIIAFIAFVVVVFLDFQWAN